MIKNSLILLLLALTSCDNSGLNSYSFPNDSVKVSQQKVSLAGNETFRKIEIGCDTIYKGKGYKLILVLIDSTNEDETIPNSLFTLSKLVNEKYVTIFSDSVFNKVQEVLFADYNNDGVKDILVQNISDARSNWTYYLYLVDTIENRLKKIRHFNEIKNPNFLSEYNLIDNYVMSGQNWTSFYKINEDSVKDYGIVIYDNQTDDGKYERDYRKAINRILMTEKNNR